MISKLLDAEKAGSEAEFCDQPPPARMKPATLTEAVSVIEPRLLSALLSVSVPVVSLIGPVMAIVLLAPVVVTATAPVAVIPLVVPIVPIVRAVESVKLTLPAFAASVPTLLDALFNV